MEGGETQVLDHELAYILLRDANADWARALMRPDAMTIPPRTEGGSVERATQAGPVFSLDPEDGALEMRYTARTVSIQWAKDPDVARAVEFLARCLADDPPFALKLRLEPGMGVVCNNVLHARTAFRDAPDRPRLLYRARFYDRAQAS